MARNFNLPTSLGWQALRKDPRVTMRVAIGVLLAANLVMAVMAFKPFGGSADDLANQRTAKETQLDALHKAVRDRKQNLEKVQVARKAGDEFLAKYFMDRQTTTSDIYSELDRIAADSGITLGQGAFQLEEIEGSTNMQELALQVGCEGTYQSLTKFVNLLDKSPRFLLVENLHAAPVQNGQKLNVTFRIDAFIMDRAGADL
jgi:Tfp pilus assembly protein PilO